jgi:hypothetical protein
MHGKRSATRRACAGAAACLVAVAALAGGAGTGQAGGTLLDVELSPLGAITSFSAGGTVGYAVSLENTGTSTVSHVALVVDTALGNATGAGTYKTSTVGGNAAASCAVHPDKSSAMLCTASQLAPNDGFSVNVAFTAPATFVATVATDPVTFNASATATVSAQTNGNPGNNGTSSWSNGAPVSTTLTKASDLSFRTFSLPGEDPFETGVKLKTKLDLPATFLNDHFGLVTETGEYADADSRLCDKCPIVFSNVSIPASLTSSSPFALFVDDVLTSTNPYTFELKLNPSGQPPGYKASGISHRGDAAGAVFEPVPLCGSISGLSAADPICLDGLPSKDKKTGVITATGKGIENGSYGWD